MIRHDITIHKGSEFRLAVKIEEYDETGNIVPVDLSGMGFEMAILPYYGYEPEEPEQPEDEELIIDRRVVFYENGYIASEESEGILFITVPAEDTMGFDFSRPAVYDLKIKNGTSTETYMHGDVYFIENVSPLPASIGIPIDPEPEPV